MKTPEDYKKTGKTLKIKPQKMTLQTFLKIVQKKSEKKGFKVEINQNFIKEIDSLLNSKKVRMVYKEQTRLEKVLLDSYNKQEWILKTEKIKVLKNRIELILPAILKILDGWNKKTEKIVLGCVENKNAGGYMIEISYFKHGREFLISARKDAEYEAINFFRGEITKTFVLSTN